MKANSVLLFVLMLLVMSYAMSKRTSYYALDKFTKLRPTIESTCGQLNCTADNPSCPTFSFANADCENDFCVYFPAFQYDICTDPSQCGSGNCICDATGPSSGCKCSNDSECVCYNGICQGTSGLLGQYCDELYSCEVGVCNKTNQCELVPEGGTCDEDSDCDLLHYCNMSTCIQRPLCNETSGENSIGYCEHYGVCSNGTCYPLYTQTQGYPCLSMSNCAPGLTCVANGTQQTCESIALGAACNTDFDCEYETQQCVCTEPDDSFPTVCSDIGMKCTQEMASLMACSIQYDCFLYDMHDMTTACGKNCYPILVENFCCFTCLYPQFSDNATPNIVGSCASGNITAVNCCSNDPCVFTTTADLCYGYKHD